MYRNHNCGELNIKNVGQEVVLAGWIQKIRNLGAMKFIDLRDQFGITQIIISEDLKDTNPLEWVGKMNNIKNRAEEIVLKELIYV